jgi:hypothetical protein
MSTVVGFGGLLIPEEKLRALQDRIGRIRDRFDVPKEEELKWSPRRDSWISQNLHGDERRRCYALALRAARKRGAKAFVVCIDTEGAGYSRERALERALVWCFERVTMCLQDCKSLGIIVCDRPGGGKKEEDEMLERVLSTIQRGTDYVPASTIPINVLTTPSHLVTELQLADIVTGVTTAMIAGDTKYAAPLFEEVIPMFHENTYGTVGGTGLKLYPNWLLNLHYWVGKEDTFLKVGMNGGWSLPWRDWAYSKSGDKK